MTTSNRLTLAGAAVSLAIAYLNLRPWWKSGRKIKDLAPFGGMFLLGAVSTMCVGGLLGWLAGCSAAGANTAGGRAVPGATGKEPGSALAHSAIGSLTPEGGVVVFLAAVAAAAAWKAAGKADQRRMAGGVFVGSTVTLTAGVAGALAWLPDAVNGLGAGLRGTLEGTGIL